MIKAIALGTFAVSLLFTPVMARDKKGDSGFFEKKSDKERIYKASIETMWKACIKTAAEDNAIDYSNEKEGIITYKSGMSMSSGGFE